MASDIFFSMYKPPLTSRAEQIGYTLPNKAIGRGQ